MPTTFTARKGAEIDAWFKAATRGKSARIKYGERTFVLFDAKKVPQGYAEREYGVTTKELKAFAKRMHAQNEKELKAGLGIKFSGNIEDLL